MMRERKKNCVPGGEGGGGGGQRYARSVRLKTGETARKKRMNGDV